MSKHVVDLNEHFEEHMDRLVESGKRNFVGAHELARFEQEQDELFRHNFPEFFFDDVEEVG